MLKSAYEGLNARPKVYLSKEYFCEMYPTCVSSKLCEFIKLDSNDDNDHDIDDKHFTQILTSSSAISIIIRFR